MSLDLNIFSASWRRRFRRELLLGPKPPDGGGVDGARSVVLVKRDNIGDFILATTFLNRAYEAGAWRDKEVTLVCAPHLEGLARAFYPRWRIRAVADSRGDYRHVFLRPKTLRAEVMGWAACDLMVSLRAMRRQDELVFDSWIPARHKVALANQLAPFEPRTMRRGLDEGKIYNEIPGGAVKAAEAVEARTTEEVCADIANYRALLDYCFPGEAEAEANRRALPAVPRHFLQGADAEGRLAEMEKAHGFSRGGKGYLAVFPFSSAAIKNYPAPLLAGVIGRIAEKHALPVVIFGGRGDIAQADALLGAVTTSHAKISLAGKISVAEMILCMRGAAGVLSVDTAGAHAAIASGAPTVVMLGGGHYGQFGPWGARASTRWVKHRVPCYGCSWNCKQARVLCIEDIPPDEIVAAFGEVMGGL